MESYSGFDRPLFKRLASNDTTSAKGHQGGPLIPKDLYQFFPKLTGIATASSPTVEKSITAALFIGESAAGIVSSRYQYQTRGATRTPERRLTRNLTPIMNIAKKNDYLIIERSLNNPDFYRLTLLKAGTAEYVAISKQVGARKWGPLDRNDEPISEVATEQAFTEQTDREAGILKLFDNATALVEKRTLGLARSRAFQSRILELYNSRCALCGKALQTPAGLSEIEAAHIVPRALRGADDARNGLALCRSHHWAFDRGLFGVGKAGTILIPAKVSALPQNFHLNPFASQALRPPSNSSLSPAPEAFEWHWENVVKRIV
jgi:putative restriction endonuclease